MSQTISRAGRRDGRSARLLAAGVGGWLAWLGAGPAHSQSTTGPDLRVGDLRGQFDTAFGNLAPTGSKAWEVIYGIGLSETYDNGVPVRGRFGSDLITRISPSISVSANTSRIEGNVVYAPALNLYTFHGNQTYVSQNLNGSITTTLVPDLLFVDLRAFAAEQPAYGNQLGTTYGSQGQVQTTSFSIAPRLQHRFGGTGTLTIGDTFTRSQTYSPNSNNNNTNVNTGAGFNPYLSSVYSGTSVTNAQNVNFTTGEDFGRLNNSFDVTASQTQGGGAQPSSHRFVYGYDGQYALTRVFTVTAGIGHEDISYSGINPIKINDITWSGGIKVTPDADTLMAIRYGHHDGGNSLSLDGKFAPTGRSLVLVSYGQSIGTQLDRLQANVNSSRTSALGISYDPVTGAPVQVDNNFATGAQLPVYRTTTASLTGVLNYDRDIVSMTVSHDDQEVLSTTAQNTTAFGTPVSSSGYQASVAWTHTISQDMFTNSAVIYSNRSAPFRTPGTVGTSPNQTSLTFNLSLSYSLSRSLTATAQYTRVSTTGAFYGQPPSHDLATISLLKTF